MENSIRINLGEKMKENIVILVWNEKSIGYIFLILFLGGLTINIEIQGRDGGGEYYFYEWYRKYCK